MVNIKRRRKPIKVLGITRLKCSVLFADLWKREEPPQKISKLAIAAETEQDRYDTTTVVKCYECKAENIDPQQGKLAAVVDGILKASTFAKQAEVKAWEQELTPCEHTLCLEQQAARQIESQGKKA